MPSRGRVFIVEDDELIASMVSRMLYEEGYKVIYESSEFKDIVRKIRDFGTNLLILDIALPGANGIDILREIKPLEPDTGVLMLTSDDSIESAITCMKMGASDYLTKPFNLEELKMVVNSIFTSQRLNEEVSYLRHICKDLFTESIIGQSVAIQSIRSRIKKMADAKIVTLLITGESGTGKELIAREMHKALHSHTDPNCTPFVAVNCSAMPEHLLESELFGYEKGAFTDAKTQKKGLFELAKGGTLFLDEIGDMKTTLQSKLLRALEERRFMRIGGNKEIALEATVIASTNVDLQDAIKRGDFRLDLYYRLNTFSIHMPPLRERPEDIPLLVSHFLNHFKQQYRNRQIKEFTQEAMQLLLAYHWPGNVRELKNMIERIVVLETEPVIGGHHLPYEISRKAKDSPVRGAQFVLPDEGICLEDLEKDLIRQALNRAKGNKTLAARLLNITYDTLRYQLKKFALE
jgi:DNA-binding NtrC family response regulator